MLTAFLILILALIGLLLLTQKVISKIEPRTLPEPTQSEPKPTQIEPQSTQNNPIKPTKEELYDAGWTTKIIEKDGKLCIEKQNEIIYCSE